MLSSVISPRVIASTIVIERGFSTRRSSAKCYTALFVFTAGNVSVRIVVGRRRLPILKNNSRLVLIMMSPWFELTKTAVLRSRFNFPTCRCYAVDKKKSDFNTESLGPLFPSFETTRSIQKAAINLVERKFNS